MLTEPRCQDCLDAYEERAAILEYDGEYSRATAERMALAELYRRHCGCRQLAMANNEPDERPEAPALPARDRSGRSG